MKIYDFTVLEKIFNFENYFALMSTSLDKRLFLLILSITFFVVLYAIYKKK